MITPSPNATVKRNFLSVVDRTVENVDEMVFLEVRVGSDAEESFFCIHALGIRGVIHVEEADSIDLLFGPVVVQDFSASLGDKNVEVWEDCHFRRLVELAL